MPRAATQTRTPPQDTDPWVPLDDFLTEAGISASTYYNWRDKGRAPTAKKMPNGQVRMRRSAINHWWANLPDAT